MRHLLLLLLTFTLFSCSDDSNDKEPSVSYWRVIEKQKYTFLDNDTSSTASWTSTNSVDSTYMKVLGNDLIVYVVDENGNYSTKTTSCAFNDNSPFFSISSSTVMDADFGTDESPFTKFSGYVTIHMPGVTFKFYTEEKQGVSGSLEFEEIDFELPKAEWTLSDEELFVDWKTFFGF